MYAIEEKFMYMIQYMGASEKQMKTIAQMDIMNCPLDMLVKYLMDIMEMVGISKKSRKTVLMRMRLHFAMVSMMGYISKEQNREAVLELFIRIIEPEITEVAKAKKRAKDRKKMRKILKVILEMNDIELEAFLAYMDNYEYLVCVDMGCGSTSAAYVQKVTNWENIIPVSIRHARFVLEMQDYEEEYNHTDIHTLLGYNGRSAVIGPTAFQYGTVAQNFKALPDEENLSEKILTVEDFYGQRSDISRKEIWEDYFEKIFQIILMNINRELSGREGVHIADKTNTLFVVAHPASAEWAKYLAPYKALVTAKTKLKERQVLTISEAKAAMQYVRTNASKCPNLDYGEGVLMIDIGASTIDIEYLIQTEPEPREWSITLAGKEIDCILGHCILEQWFPGEIKNYPLEWICKGDFSGETGKAFEDFIEKKFRISRSEFFYRIRLYKEAVCDFFQEAKKEADKNMINHKHLFAVGAEKIGMSGEELEYLIEKESVSFICRDIKQANYMNKKLNPGQDASTVAFSQVLQSASWYEHLENFVSYVMDSLMGENDKKFPVHDIIITGGSSRLVGVQEHIKRGIKKSGRKEILETVQITMLDSEIDYNRSVPFGSCSYVGGVLGHMKEFDQFPGQLEYIFKQELVAVSARYVAEESAELVKAQVQNALNSWYMLSKSNVNSSQNGLNRLLQEEMGKLSDDDLQKKVKQGLQNLEAQKNVELKETLDTIQGFLNGLAKTKYKHSVDISDIKLNLDVNIVTGAVLKGLRRINCDALQSSLMGWISGAFTKVWNNIKELWGAGKAQNDIQWGDSYRKNVRDEFAGSSQDTVLSDLKSIISAELSVAYDENDGFGITERIIVDLEDDIKRALYLN